MMYETIKRHFETGLWNVQRVWNVTEKGVITEEEYEEITGYEFPEKE